MKLSTPSGTPPRSTKSVAEPQATVLYAGRRLIVGGDGLIVGRGEDSGLVIANERVSRQHARFYFRDGRYWIADIDTRNTTYLSGSRFVGESHPLASG